MNITTELIKELRDNTGISIMQCKRALEEAGGDMQKALAILKKTSSEIAMKKKERESTPAIKIGILNLFLNSIFFTINRTPAIVPITPGSS